MRKADEHEIIALANFGERLKEARKTIGLKVPEMCQLLGIQTTAYYKYEDGSRFPKPEILLKLTEDLGISVDFLISGLGSMFSGKDDYNEPGGISLLCEPGQLYGEDYETLKDLLYHMELSPLVRLAVLKFFVEYKHEKNTLIKKDIEAYRKQMRKKRKSNAIKMPLPSKRK